MDRRTYFTTDEVAQAAGIPKITLKRWLASGKVFEPARNPENNYRIWSQEDLARVLLIPNRKKKLPSSVQPIRRRTA